ncbi:MAG: YfiR family protein [Gemmatimonadales bacterium]
MAFLINVVTSALLVVQAQRAPEHQVKAVFLFNFAQFIDWPATGAPDPATPLIIGILGNDPFGSLLDEIVRGERIGARPFEVRRYRQVADIEGCNILFVSRSESARVPQILEALKSRPILTVSEGNAFAKQGGMIQFVNDKNRIRLRINLEAAQAVNLTISSKLLRVAEIVGPAPR